MSADAELLRVLILEDVDDDAELVLRELRRSGLSFRHHRVQTEAQFCAALDEFRPDVILSDFSVPGFGGEFALAITRTMFRDLPFIFVSGTIGEETAVQALKGGATDYVLKQNLARLVPAVRRAVTESAERVARRSAEAKVRENEKKFELILDNSFDAFIITDALDNITLWSKQAEVHFGWLRDEVIGRRLASTIVPPRFRQQHLEDMERFLASGESGILNTRFETYAAHRDGHEIPVEVTVSPLRVGGDQIFCASLRDIAERKAYEARIEYLAHHDALTELPNRNLLADRLNQAMSHARRAGRLLAVMVLDLDQFKFVNDSLGHPAGDSLLKLVSRKLNALLRDGDTVSRLGGDEFAILLTDVDRVEDVTHVARKILDSFSEPFTIQGHEFVITASIGISLFPQDGEDGDALLKAADSAMYRAKKQGRNDFRLHTQEMGEEVHDHVRLESALRKALSRGEFELHYQPQVELPAGRVIGVEALIRWQHPEQGLVPPSRFIPLAEETGLIVPIGEWVLRTACAWIKGCQDRGMSPIDVAVNLSARQLTHGNLVETVSRVLAETGLDPRYLELELTESMIMHNAESLVSLLSRLKGMGVRISIDDFGTGYSNLSYLKRFPIDRIKIDQTFVRDITVDKDDEAICTAIISLAHSLNLKAIAEGVETMEQLAVLLQHGCDEVQGYFISRPRPAEECEAFLVAREKQAARFWR